MDTHWTRKLERQVIHQRIETVATESGDRLLGPLVGTEEPKRVDKTSFAKHHVEELGIELCIMCKYERASFLKELEEINHSGNLTDGVLDHRVGDVMGILGIGLDRTPWITESMEPFYLGASDPAKANSTDLTDTPCSRRESSGLQVQSHPVREFAEIGVFRERGHRTRIRRCNRHEVKS
jgi:hypothetical protein